MPLLPDKAYLIAIDHFRPFGAIRLGKLISAFSSAQEIFKAPTSALIKAGIEPKHAKGFCDFRKTLNPENIWEHIQDEGIHIVTIKDQHYPPLLKEIYDPPALLYYRGTLPEPTNLSLAVVGSRRASPYAFRVAEQLIRPLAKSHTTIVSGLAYGIDTIAHTITLEEQGITVAVLGSGCDQKSIYPAKNKKLAERIIASGGAVLCEFPPGTPPLKQHFPFRNRVIAGLSSGTLVIEAAQKSGSLITAKSALESGREVYAVPGPIHHPLSQGPNNLLKMGARVVTCAQDILPNIKTPKKNTPTFKPSSKIEKQLWKSLSLEPKHIDELSQETNLTTPTLLSTLTLLEIQGVIRPMGGQYYARTA